jgi:hypothetical protein
MVTMVMVRMMVIIARMSPCLASTGPEFKPQYFQKKNKTRMMVMIIIEWG